MSPPSSSSSRWSPTTEQLMILEELYRTGIRTPSASQIQQITTHLSFYGRIEGKNVFYWFQNHKARDRQKLRRKLNKQLQLQQQFQTHHCQVLNQDHFTTNYPFVGSFGYPPCSTTQDISFYNSPSLLFQVNLPFSHHACGKPVYFFFSLSLSLLFSDSSPFSNSYKSIQSIGLL
jgi:hypothetical protein